MVYKKQDWGNESEEERIDRESAETDFAYEIIKDLRVTRVKLKLSRVVLD